MRLGPSGGRANHWRKLYCAHPRERARALPPEAHLCASSKCHHRGYGLLARPKIQSYVFSASGGILDFSGAPSSSYSPTSRTNLRPTVLLMDGRHRQRSSCRFKRTSIPVAMASNAAIFPKSFPQSLSHSITENSKHFRGRSKLVLSLRFRVRGHLLGLH
jgi:hypothetical protein